MKKIIVTVLAIAMSLALFGCSKGNAGSKGGKETDAEVEETKAVKDTEAAEKSAQEISDAKVSSNGGSYTFEFSSDLRLDENAWLGLCPAGKSYVKEVDADEDDIFWVYADNYADVKPGVRYKFFISSEDIASFEEGEYTMVLCDNDDEGKVILYFPLTVKGAELIADFSKIKIN